MGVRTRMAPSPTGEYHIGSMRTMLYNYALAKKEGGQFILRIEDTDRERFVEGATERLMDVINAYGLNWDEGPRVGGPHAPYIQSERLETYKEYANQLVESGHAYYCFCSKERLDDLRKKQIKEKKEDFDLQACYAKLTEFTRIPFIGQHICGVCVKTCTGKIKTDPSDKNQALRAKARSLPVESKSSSGETVAKTDEIPKPKGAAFSAKTSK